MAKEFNLQEQVEHFDEWWDSLTREQQKRESDEAIRWYEER